MISRLARASPQLHSVCGGSETIPKAQQEVLLEIGKWLEVNSESIYGTHAWKQFGEGYEKGSPPPSSHAFVLKVMGTRPTQSPRTRSGNPTDQ